MLQIPVAKVAVLAATFAFDRPYTYKIPQPLTETLRPGCRVMVPFSRGNRPCEGMVLALDQAQDDPKLKPITRQLDPEPILSPELIRLAIWMHDRFFCTIYDALHAILPAGVWYRVSTVYCAALELDADAALTLCGRSKQRRLALETVLAHGGRCPLETLQTAFGDKDPASALHWLVEQKLLTVEGAEKRVVRDKQLEYASLAVSLEEAQEEIRRRRRAPHQVAILELLCTIGRASADEVCQFTGAPKSSMKTLVRQELVRIDTEPYFRRPTHYTGQPKPIPALTAVQAEVFSGLQALLRSPDAQAALLFGVTGSGKTLVYLHLIEQTLAAGQGAILLVPEISLTAQTVGRFRSRFGETVAVFHSRLSAGERLDQWDMVASGAARVVVGARSALFCPLDDLGLIIIDEEHETSYKQGSSPRYHAREVAAEMARRYRCPLVLGSATPSAEALDRCRRGTYNGATWTRVEMPERPGHAVLPTVRIADLRREFAHGSRSMFSKPLMEGLERVVERREKAVLLHNRRGFAPFLMCRECGCVPTCNHCSTALTYHERTHTLQCHTCGSSWRVQPYPAPTSRCPKCGSRYLAKMGMGTQQIEDALHQMLPEDVAIIRMDADSTRGKDAHKKLLEQFDAADCAVLLGTQMIAKGLDFPEVTLVGVVNADFALKLPDFRAGERAYDLLEQVAGRAGRGDRPGEVIIQTYLPDDPVIRAVAEHDRSIFTDYDLDQRRDALYPPFVRLVNILVWSANRDDAQDYIGRIAKLLKRRWHAAAPDFLRAGSVVPQVLGPASCVIERAKDRYRFHLLAKSPVGYHVSDDIDACLKEVGSVRGVSVSVDVDAYDLM